MRFKVSRETSLHPMETLKYLQSSQLERSVSDVKDEHNEQQRRKTARTTTAKQNLIYTSSSPQEPHGNKVQRYLLVRHTGTQRTELAGAMCHALAE